VSSAGAPLSDGGAVLSSPPRSGERERERERERLSSDMFIVWLLLILCLMYGVGERLNLWVVHGARSKNLGSLRHLAL